MERPDFDLLAVGKWAIPPSLGVQPRRAMILFGVRSPLVVDYEETCGRLGIEISSAVSVNGAPRIIDRSRVVELAEFDPCAARDVFIACAFSPERRAALKELATKLGLALSAALVDPTAILPRTTKLGAGSFVNAGVVLGAASIIGENVVVNRSASLGHHTVLGDNVSIGPGATLAGNIHVGAGSLIGAGAVVLPHLRIGEGVVVAAGSLVRRHVPAGAFVAGHPAVQQRFRPGSSSLNLADSE